MLIERDRVLRDLSPLLKIAPTAFREAMKRARTAPTLDLLDRSKTSASNLTRDYALAEFQRAWFGIPDLKFVTVNRAQLFIFGQQYSVRIKKLDDQSRSSNVRTKQSRLYSYQGQLEGLPSLCNLDLGYVLTLDGLEIADTRLVCLNGPKPFWATSIEYPDNSAYDLFPNVRGPAPSEPKRPTPKDGDEELGVKITPKR